MMLTNMMFGYTDVDEDDNVEPKTRKRQKIDNQAARNIDVLEVKNALITDQLENVNVIIELILKQQKITYHTLFLILSRKDRPAI